MTRQFLYESGHDADAMFARAHRVAALITGLIPVLVWWWSRRLYGDAAGLLSLLLCALSPNLLAHGRLLTSDAMLTLLLLGATTALWIVLHRVTAWSLLASSLATAALQLAKFSGALIAPIGLILVGIRLAWGPPLELRLGRRVRRVETRGAQLGVIAALVLVHVGVTAAAVWGLYGFRFEALADTEPGNRLMVSWERLLDPSSPVSRAVGFARDRELLPEAFLYGFSFVRHFGQERDAFLRGERRRTGWWYFFPYAAAVKTPLGLFVLLVMATALPLARTRGAGPPPPRAPDVERRGVFYESSPLVALFAVYWALALTTSLNLGLRHVLPTYPVLFIWAGAAASWVRARHGLASVVVVAATGWFVAASFGIRPHYLAYFNESVGPENGYRHLVDSSLDWGQNLPGLARWLKAEAPPGSGTRVYLSHFGSAPPAPYGIRALPLPSYFPWWPEGPDGRRLNPSVFLFEPGLYAVSATMLQTVYSSAAGAWTAEREDAYWRARKIVDAALDPALPAAERLRRINEPDAHAAYRALEPLRFGRLAAWLRAREPDASIGHATLIYRLDEEDLRDALYRPPAELVPGAMTATPRLERR